MNQNQKNNWWINVLLLLSFLVTFFLDLTGVMVHQWFGIVSFTLAAFHIFLHQNWLKTIYKRFFHKQTGKARLNFVVDGFLLFGFVTIVLTGLIMSTWLNLALPNYDVWRKLHIIVSIITLVIILIKLALHLRWLEQTTRRMFTRDKMKPVLMPQNTVLMQAPNTNSQRIGRREFLVTMGVVSAASILALASASKSLAESITVSKTNESDPDPSLTPTNINVATQSVESTATPQATETVAPTEQPTETLASPSASVPSATPSSETYCIVLCNRGCSYPGHCHRYVDANNNGLCDMGECL